MNKFLTALMLVAFLAFPVVAQSQIPDIRTYKLLRAPGRQIVVVNRSPSSCNPPLEMLQKHISELENYSLSNPYRILAPNTPTTMDYSEERINFTVDNNGFVRAISCG